MRFKCRYCGNERKPGVQWYDDDYCSGKCKKLDGGEIRPPAERAKASGEKATLEDYYVDYPKNLGEIKNGQKVKGRLPKRYCRRFEPEKLNWGEPLSDEHLAQAGLRANRVPIPGDWDYEAAEEAEDIRKELENINQADRFEGTSDE